jgi:hypothetical protein
MAVKKTVAAPQAATIPATASGADELKVALEPVTAPQEVVEETTSGAAAATRVNNLAKARAAKAAKKIAALKAEALEAAEIKASVRGFQAAIAAETAQDRHSFGEIKEVARVAPTAEEYVRVEMPLADLFDHTHPGVQLNRHKFEPGKTYLLRGDVALEVKKRLAMFHDEQVRLLRPNADRKALADVNRGSQWTSRGSNAVVPLGRLEDVAVASDEKIYTVDF